MNTDSASHPRDPHPFVAPPGSYQATSALGTNWQEVVDQACAQLDLAVPPSLVIVFVAGTLVPHMSELSAELVRRCKTYAVVGCSAESIAAGADEFEQTSGLAIWTATWPTASVDLMHLRLQHAESGPELIGWPANWPDDFSATDDMLLLLGEPFSFPADYLLEQLARERPRLRVVGGMASGGNVPGENALMLGGDLVREGAIGVLLRGVHVSTVVSQGCRPIGEAMIVTQSEKNVISQLGGRPALVRLQELFEQLPNHEKELVQQGLHLGRAVTEYQDAFAHGDFLVRNVIGIHPPDGSIAVGDYMRVGQTVRFHIRDRHIAHDDLRQLLDAHRAANKSADRGALLFTCNGRGTRLFEDPSHDAGEVSQTYPGIALAGFFAQGELGPVGPRSFVHGFTASIALFG